MSKREWKAVTLDELEPMMKAHAALCPDLYGGATRELTDQDPFRFNQPYEFYSPEIVALIDEYEAAGKFPYNRNIERLVRERLFPGIPDPSIGEVFQDGRCPFLSAIVYHTQSFRHERIEKAQTKIFEDQVISQGFESCDSDMSSRVNGLFWVYLTPRQKKKLRLREDGERLIWMAPNAFRRGFYLQPNQWAKEISK